MHAGKAIAQEHFQHARQAKGRGRIAKRSRFTEDINAAGLRWFDRRKNYGASRARNSRRKKTPAKLLVIAENGLAIDSIDQ